MRGLQVTWEFLGWRPDMLRRALVVAVIALLVALAAVLSSRAAGAQGGPFGPVDSWCCGIADCGALQAGSVRAASGGYVINGPVSYFKSVHHSAGGATVLGPFDHSEWVHEFVPYREARPSPDGYFWRCKKPDGSRRCFFAPKPSM